MLRLMKPLDGSATTADPLQRNRQLLADLCRLIGSQVNGTPLNGVGHGAGARNGVPLHDPVEVLLKGQLLSPRMEQTLRSLLGGASEKQVAAKLGVSPHTVHVYVKALYKKYGVCSRGELLAKWVKSSSSSSSSSSASSASSSSGTA